VQNKEFQKLLLDRLENLEALLKLQIEHMERMREERNNARYAVAMPRNAAKNWKTLWQA
jgi:hypothetical protein